LDKVKKGQEINIHIPYKNKDIKGIVTLPNNWVYGNIATAYPDYEMQESLFEIKIIPSNSEEAKDLIAKNYNLIPLKYAKFLDTSRENLNSSGKIKFSDCYQSTVALWYFVRLRLWQRKSNRSTDYCSR
jgi:hypothetical protein